MKTGFLFPGQGSQSVGMGKDLYEAYEEVRNVYQKVKEITGIDIAKVSFEGPEELLNTTEMTQLAILTQSLAIVELLKKHQITANRMAGLSLGEYTALITDEVIDFKDGIEIVQKRGKIMQENLPEGNWKMAAIIGVDKDTINQICDEVNGFVKVANYNTIGQIVISGEESAVLEVSEKLKTKGARKVIVLNTAGPFHTEKFDLASKKFKEELSKISFDNKDSKVIKNLDGTPYMKDENIVEVLSNHIKSPVKFTDCLTEMYKSGIDTFIEVGPGKALSGFVKRMNFETNIRILNINDVNTFKSVIKELTGKEI